MGLGQFYSPLTVEHTYIYMHNYSWIIYLYLNKNTPPHISSVANHHHNNNNNHNHNHNHNNNNNNNNNNISTKTNNTNTSPRTFRKNKKSATSSSTQVPQIGEFPEIFSQMVEFVKSHRNKQIQETLRIQVSLKEGIIRKIPLFLDGIGTPKILFHREGWEDSQGTKTPSWPLVGGLNPSEKIWSSNGIISPRIGVKIKKTYVSCHHQNAFMTKFFRKLQRSSLAAKFPQESSKVLKWRRVQLHLIETLLRVCRIITWKKKPKKIGETLHHQGLIYTCHFLGPIFPCNGWFLWWTPWSAIGH